MGRDLSSKAMRRQLAQGRLSLLVMVAVTLVNQLLLVLGAEYHFLWSAAAPYYLCWVSRQLGFGKLLPALIAVAVTAAYGLCWRLSGQRRGWMAVALGIYGVDTLLLILFAATLLRDPNACILEILTHGAVLALLAAAVRGEGRLRRMTQKSQLRTEIETF